VFSGLFAFFVDPIKLLFGTTSRPEELYVISLNKELREKDGKQAGVSGMQIFGMVSTFFNKPNYVEELFVTKNAFYSKH